MSIDLDWSALNAELTQNVIDFLETAFATTTRPNFLGDIHVTSFSFGDTEPELELLDVRDVFHEFIQADIDGDARQREEERVAAAASAAKHHYPRPRPPSRLDNDQMYPQDILEQDEQAFFDNEDDDDEAADWQSIATSQRRQLQLHLNDSMLRPPSSALFSPGLNQQHSLILSAQHTPTQERSPLFDQTPPLSSVLPIEAKRHRFKGQNDDDDVDDMTTNTNKLPSYSSPSLQLHLKVAYSGNLTLGLSTSLLINYPTPRFMSLPLKLSVTSVALSGTMLLAFEGDRNRMHVSMLDPLNRVQGLGAANPGTRLLSGARVESEVGQTDKHVLLNVGKVEKFVLDVIRRTLESELVFPNFQTIMF
ncbi:Mitochondrial distribution and morphology protein 12 [Microbotryomycetes sp. JL221]|nr:Mitochondrial distribution and morphology protein 12 [Microbotryomycetes sp. JL221]